jgi:transposase-like protein
VSAWSIDRRWRAIVGGAIDQTDDRGREELRELRKRVRRLEQYREILKRAAAFFIMETETR